MSRMVPGEKCEIRHDFLADSDADDCCDGYDYDYLTMMLRRSWSWQL